MLPRLDAVLAPPAGGVWASCGPRQVLTGQTVPCFELIEAGHEAFVAFGDHGVRFLLVADPVFAVARTAQQFSCLALGVLSLFL